jgi:hypothetical protein
MLRGLLFFGILLTLAGSALAVTSLDNTGVERPPSIPGHYGDADVPASALLIQDQYGWGFASHVQILQGCAQSFDVITSGQIASTNFANYDKIITAGQQPDGFYTAIQTNSAKFTDYMNSGGCVSFETAAYFGQANEYITWPGGFLSPNNGGSNSVSIVDPASCLVTGVSLGELQNWNYSAHGIVANPPAGYVSCLNTNDGNPAGTCAGSFPWGNGGAFVSHQPLEWAYGFGYSIAYPTNFDCCSCGTGPNAAQETTWGAVKSLFR